MYLFRMKFVNIHLKIVSSNTFLIISDLNYNLKKIQSIGCLGFKNKSKKIPEVFNLLLKNCILFLRTKNVGIYQLKLEGISTFKLKIIKQLFNTFFVKYCKIITKFNFNGCRLKKKKRQRFGFKVTRNKNFIFRI